MQGLQRNFNFFRNLNMSLTKLQQKSTALTTALPDVDKVETISGNLWCAVYKTTRVYFSYFTVIGIQTLHEWYITTNKYSVTTSKHVNSLQHYFGNSIVEKQTERELLITLYKLFQK